MDLTDTTNIVFRYIPAPSSDRIPLLDGDLHDVLEEEKSRDRSGRDEDFWS